MPHILHFLCKKADTYGIFIRNWPTLRTHHHGMAFCILSHAAQGQLCDAQCKASGLQMRAKRDIQQQCVHPTSIDKKQA